MNRAPWPGGEILRDIVRGGLAGLVVGIVVAGFGGRLVMRLAALAVPASEGAFTENGNRIGDITLAGSAGLVVFIGLAGSILLATVWVSIAPWLPGRGVVRGVVAMPLAVALGAIAIVQADNPDFVVLDHDPAVVAILLGLIAFTAPAMAVADAWLDRRLPHAVRPASPAGIAYVALALVGLVFGTILVLQSSGQGDLKALGITVLAAGLVTVAWWGERLRGAAAPSRPLVLGGRTILVGGTGLGYLILAPELAGALGLG